MKWKKDKGMHTSFLSCVSSAVLFDYQFHELLTLEQELKFFNILPTIK
jgi:hypothetical protein